MISVAGLDDQALFAEGMSALLRQQPGLRLLGYHTDPLAFERAVDADPPQVALIDVDLGGDSGIDVGERVGRHHPELKIIFLSVFGTSGYVSQALQLRAAGFLTKDGDAKALVAAITRAAQGERAYSTSMLVEASLAQRNPLTLTEQRVLGLTLGGASTLQISAQLRVRPASVKNYASSAIGKLAARDRHDAAVIAVERGWITRLTP